MQSYRCYSEIIDEIRVADGMPKASRDDIGDVYKQDIRLLKRFLGIALGPEKT